MSDSRTQLTVNLLEEVLARITAKEARKPINRIKKLFKQPRRIVGAEEYEVLMLIIRVEGGQWDLEFGYDQKRLYAFMKGGGFRRILTDNEWFQMMEILQS